MENKPNYTKAELLEAIRLVLFYGDPSYYDNGGHTGSINMAPCHTKKRAEEALKKYCLG